jgi:hypothetical protein
MKAFIQTIFEQGLNHYTSKALIEAMNFIAELSEDDMKEWTALLDLEEKDRAYAVWKAAQRTPKILPSHA